MDVFHGWELLCSLDQRKEEGRAMTMTVEKLVDIGWALVVLILLGAAAAVLDELYFRYRVKPRLYPRELKNTLVERRNRRSRQEIQLAFATGLSTIYLTVMAFRLGLLP